VHEARAQIVAENRHAPIIPSPGPVVSLYWEKIGPWWWGILAGMPRPRRERHAREDERAELPAQGAALQHDLDATPIENTPRRDRLTWTIRRARLRMAELDARLGRTTRESAPS
jgi:hypothetical protein